MTFPEPPARIVSLVPSTTETLFALGCGERVVGITRYCVHPAEQLGGRVKVGGTKTLEVERLLALNADLVIGNVEENTQEMFELIEQNHTIPLYAAFPRSVDDALHDLRRMGTLLGVPDAARQHHDRIVKRRAALQANAEPFTYAYLIWRGPWMGINAETFIAAMLAEAGGQNVFADAQHRYFELTPALLAEAAPDVVLLSSEPFPFKDKHRHELAEASGLPQERFVLIDGEYCSWHGVRMAEAFGYLRTFQQRPAGSEGVRIDSQ
ncbi:MAG: helical backbone metal receptor [Myxococcota bacterium]